MNSQKGLGAQNKHSKCSYSKRPNDAMGKGLQDPLKPCKGKGCHSLTDLKAYFSKKLLSNQPTLVLEAFSRILLALATMRYSSYNFSFVICHIHSFPHNK